MGHILIEKNTIDTTPNSTTKEVVVYSGRAKVTRFRKLTLAPGEHTVAFSFLGNNIEEDTIKANTDNNDLKIHSASLSEEHLYFFKKKEHEKIYQTIITKIKELITILDSQTVFSLENTMVDDIRDYIRVALNDVLLEQQTSIPRLREALSFLDELRNDTSLQIISHLHKKKLLEDELSLLSEELSRIRSLDTKINNTINIVVEAKKQITCNLEINYMLPHVSWNPVYDAELATESGDVTFTYFADITQSTGEDWNNVNIILSSSPASKSIELPSLRSVFLKAYEEKRDKTIVVNEREIKDLEKSEPSPEGIDNIPAPQPKVSVSNTGITYNFILPKPCSIPSDGNHHKTAITCQTFKADVFYETIPEKMEYVYLKAEMKNTTGFPLLAGNVAVYRNGSYMGRSSLPYRAPDERFAFSFGIDEDLRVKRVVTRSLYTPAKGLSMKNVKEFIFHYYLANFKNAPVQLKLKEALYISDLKEVEIIIKEDTTAGYNHDDDGILSWNIELASHQEERVKYVLHYVVQANRSFPLDMI